MYTSISSFDPVYAFGVETFYKAIKAKNLDDAKYSLKVIERACSNAGLTYPAKELRPAMKDYRALQFAVKTAEKQRLAKLQSHVDKTIAKEVAKGKRYYKKWDMAWNAEAVERYAHLAMPYKPTLGVFKTSNGKNVFDLTTYEARSYGHWVYVRVIKGKVVVNDYRYSSTTSGHQFACSRLMDQLGVKTYLHVNMAESLNNFETHALPPMYRSIFENEIAINKKGSKAKLNKIRAAAIKGLKKQIKAARSLGAKFSLKDAATLRKIMIEDERVRVENMRVEREATAAMRRTVAKQVETFDIASL